jgi:hypothetical protein
VLIPGALERRVRAAVSRGADVRVTQAARATDASDRGLLAYEREGGGAPNERAGRRPATVFARLWRSALHPTQVVY